MKRGKEAGVSEEAQTIAERDEAEAAVQWLDGMTGGDGEYRASTIDPKAPATPRLMCEGIAERFEALQQRCEELKSVVNQRNKMCSQYFQEIEALKNRCEEADSDAMTFHTKWQDSIKKIAALEGALGDAIGDLEVVAQTQGHSIDLTQYRQALSAREEPGDVKPHIYIPDYQAGGDCRICGHVEDNPIHGTGRQSEGR